MLFCEIGEKGMEIYQCHFNWYIYILCCVGFYRSPPVSLVKYMPISLLLPLLVSVFFFFFFF